MRWLLDTNAWIHYLKHADSPIRSQLERRRAGDIAGCSVVRAELLHGALKYGVPERRTAIVRETLAPYESLPFDDAAAAKYAEIRDDLERSGQLIGPFDTQIAAVCLANGPDSGVVERG